MAVRFFILQAHYRSTLDFSNDALEASEKGYKRLMSAVGLISKLKSSSKSEFDLNPIRERCYAAMDDDFNSPILIAELFEVVRIINSIYDGKVQATQADLTALKTLMHHFVFDVLGLKQEEQQINDAGKLIDWLIELRNDAKTNRDYATSDKIRDGLQLLGIQLKDSKEGTTWNKID